MSTTPLVSVIIPVFNGGKYLSETIESVLQQSYSNIEIIAVDDGSTDNSASVLKSFGSRIRTTGQKNSGIAQASNIGAAIAQGEYIAFLDQDDLWHREKIRLQVALLSRFPTAVASYCDHGTINSHGECTAPTASLGGPRCSGQILLSLLQYTVIVTTSVVLIRRESFNKVRGFSVDAGSTAQDIDLWLKLSSIGPILYDIATLAYYRRHESNTYRGLDSHFANGVLQALIRLRESPPEELSTSNLRAIDRSILIKIENLAHIYKMEEKHRLAFKTYVELFLRTKALKYLLSAIGVISRPIEKKLFKSR